MIHIFYFSGTGNTLWSAKRLKELLSDECEIQSIPADALRPGVEHAVSIAADAVVFLFPAYALQMPAGVAHFIRQCKVSAPYIAALVTCGSHQGGALAEAARIQGAKGQPLAYTGIIPAVENYIPLFGYPRQAILNRKLPAQVRATEQCARDINARVHNRVNTFRPFCALVSALFRWGRTFMWKWYKVSDKCNACGLCAKICPSHTVTMVNGKPQFGATCEHCMACLCWCPQGALSTYGRFYPGVIRYPHPDITIHEMQI
jgi:Pyruvate/2-oxoacid:ferredoxin oxidoreductase delta subunit